MTEIILATSNKGKIKELSALLAPLICIPQTDLGISDADEIGLSFIENAIIKARHASHCAQRPALADDSGLVVPALNGAPGIYSARYAGAQANDQNNIDLLLNNMVQLVNEERKAYFYCAIAIVQHANDPTPLIATGICHGEISTEQHGDDGFGYDPIFYVPQHQCTAAQMSASIKNSISHRAQALNQLRTVIPNLL